MRCDGCDGQLETFDGQVYCPDCDRFALVPDADPDDLADMEAEAGLELADDLDGDHATALRDAGWGTDEDYGCFDAGEW